MDKPAKKLTDIERKRKIEQLKELERQEIALLQQKKQYQDDNKIEFFDKAPNPGPNPPQAMLLQAWKDTKFKVFTFTGGNRCLGAEVEIYDPVLKTSTPISKIDGPFHVWAWDGDKLVIAGAEKPFFKGVEKAYRVQFSTGGEIIASAGHRILTPNGYRSVGGLHQGCAVVLPASNLECGPSIHASNVPSSLKRVQGFLSCCLAYFRSCGERLLLGRGSGRPLSPLRGDAQEHIVSVDSSREDGLGNTVKHSRLYQLFCRPSTLGGLRQTLARFFVFLYHASCKVLRLFGSGIITGLLPNIGFYLRPQPTAGFSQPANLVFCNGYNHDYRFRSNCSPFLSVLIGAPSATITNISTVGQKAIWDFHVPKYFNYFCEGVINHNSGKTCIACILSICVAAGEWLWTGHSGVGCEKILFPHNRPRKIRIVGQDWESHIKAVVVKTLTEWWPKNRPVKIRKNTLGVDSNWVDEKTGSTIQILSNKQDPGVHEGEFLDLVYYDEPPTREIRVANSRGLVDRRGRELFAMTLLKEAWVDRDVIKAVDEKTGRPDRSVFNVVAKIYDNIGYGITLEGVEQFAKTLTPEEREARLDGKPSYLSGLVCKNFNRNTHLKERFPIPLDWPVDFAFDIHPRKPQYVLFVATQPDGKRYACFEICEHGDGTQIAEAAMRIVSRYGLRVNRVLIDPLSKSDANADQTGNTTYDKINNVLMRYGYLLEVATKDKVSGILEINNHLKGPNNEPSLFFFDDLVVTIRQVEGWTYEDKGDDKGKPRKVDDDMPENLYRLLLLDTQYIHFDNEENTYEEPVCVNEVTGY